ncbi:MAG: hypothetical protein H8E14_13300 [Candidatus Marinimicrobia bacterium]|nr:hypothetical protein [Candidatus Neomarinimicrobiota bacterium]
MKRSAYIFSIIFVISYLFTITGCAGSVALKQHTRASIKSVTISKDVRMPNEMFYQEIIEDYSGTLGANRPLAAERGRKDTKKIIKGVMDKSDVDIKKTVINKFSHQLKNSNLFDEVLTECDSCPIFSLSVSVFGFAGSSNQLKPMLGITGMLTKPENSVLWKKYVYVSYYTKDTPSHTLEEYFKEPELIREAFTLASEIVANDMINHLQGD